MIILGKQVLEKGFCQSIKAFTTEEYLEVVKKLEEQIPKGYKLKTISMTSGELLQRFNCEVPPTILQYEKDVEPIVNPRNIWANCIVRNDMYRPSADFVIFKGQNHKNSDGVAVAAYSKTAPILVFENIEGTIAIGTILRPQLIKYGEYIFETILDKMGDKVSLSVPLCTHYEYPGWGTIPRFIKNLAEKYDIPVVISYDTEETDFLFGNEDNGNNVVIAW